MKVSHVNKYSEELPALLLPKKTSKNDNLAPTKDSLISQNKGDKDSTSKEFSQKTGQIKESRCS